MFEQYTCVGVWGLGVVGRATITFLRTQYPALSLYTFDIKELSPADHDFLKSMNCTLAQNLMDFLERCDVIVPSPGIDLRPSSKYKHKFVHEVDIFFNYWHKKVIAITGTVGKTTITSIISQLLKNGGLRVATGGNIGTALLDLLPLQEQSDVAVIELSSFQLEYAQNCKPDIAVITNLFPNHLDRHGTLEDYLTAKLNIARHQTADQKLIIPAELYAACKRQLLHQNCVLFGAEPLTDADLPSYYMHEQQIMHIENKQSTIVLNAIPDISYPLNWVIMAAIGDSMGIEINTQSISQEDVPEHRLDLVEEIDGCAFFDDSKSTIMESTLAATKKISTFDTVLLLGGISKGVDRAPYFAQLQTQVREVICFGKEAAELDTFAKNYAFKSSQAATLEEAFALAVQHTKAYRKPAVLLSPGGASFDLFAHYKARGTRFKQLVADYAKNFAKEDNSL